LQLREAMEQPPVYAGKRTRHKPPPQLRPPAKATGKDEWYALFYCYRFMTDTLPHPGYDEARRLHGEEMEARGLLSAREFCFSLVESLDELLLRVRSIASWIEAQKSFSLWLVFRNLQSGWRGERDERACAIPACYLAELPRRCLVRTTHRGRELITARFPEGVGVETNYEGRAWNDGEWKNILEQAARLTAKRYDCTELERCLWWAYPVFRRFRGLMTPMRTRSLRTETNVRSFGLLSGFVYVRGACLCLRSHATFFGITRPPFTSARVLSSFGSSTPTSAGSAARNPQKFATPLYLNAALRTTFGVSERRAFAIRESRTGADDDSRYREGAGEGAGDASALGSGVGMRTASSYG
jgi:hypothetical protein